MGPHTRLEHFLPPPFPSALVANRLIPVRGAPLFRRDGWTQVLETERVYYLLTGELTGEGGRRDSCEENTEEDRRKPDGEPGEICRGEGRRQQEDSHVSHPQQATQLPVEAGVFNICSPFLGRSDLPPGPKGRLWVSTENGAVFLQLDLFCVTDNSDVLFHPGILEFNNWV